VSTPFAIHRSVTIPAAGVALGADLGMPATPPRGAVLFAHGSGSSRRSPRNRQVADELNGAGLATVLADLLTPKEEQTDQRTAEFRFNVDLLGERVTAVADWMANNEPTAGLGIGLFGASTGAAAALIAAARRPSTVQAVVSRGGRPDLADAVLPRVRQPTLLIVGERDPTVIQLNRQALLRLGGEARLEIVPRATHLFEEPGALEHVARLARDWFLRHLRRISPTADNDRMNDERGGDGRSA
jgi:dienelactone hydrolase